MDESSRSQRAPRPRALPDRARVVEWHVTALCLGVCVASLYALSGLPGLSSQVPVRELLVAIALAALPATALILLLVDAAALVSFVVLRRWLGRAERSALQVALACLALCAALMLPLAAEFHLREFLLALILPPLLALFCALWVQRSVVAARPYGLCRVLLVLTPLAVLLGCGVMLARTPHAARSTSASASASKPAPAGRPNVVWIVLDTTRADFLGSYGDGRKLTPVLDAFAKQATVYDDAFSAAPWTIPSHASMFTGLYPTTHGARDEHHLWLDSSYVTLAETLRASGYQTIALNSNFYLQEVNILQGFEISRYVDATYAQAPLMRLSRFFGVPERWVDKGASEALDYTQRWLAEARDPKRPFFLFVNLYETHASYVPPYAERAAQLPQDASFTQLSKFALLSGADDVLPARFYRGEDAPRARRWAQALYAAEVRYQDRKLGELLRAIASASALDDTLVIITADHGENLGEATRWEHQFAINDLLIHVPLIVRYPRSAGNVGRLSGLCSLVDLYPTVVEVLGLPPAKTALPGRSLTPRSFQAQDAVFSEVDPYYELLGAVELARGHAAGLGDFKLARRVARTASHKYIWRSDGQSELYDMAHDPYEEHNLAAQEPTLTAQLARQLDTWRSSQPAYEPSRGGSSVHAPVARDAAARLRALGYAQ